MHDRVTKFREREGERAIRRTSSELFIHNQKMKRLVGNLKDKYGLVGRFLKATICSSVVWKREQRKRENKVTEPI